MVIKMKKLLIILAALILLVSCAKDESSSGGDAKSAPSSESSGETNVKEYYSSTVGMWYEVLYSGKEQSEKLYQRHWFEDSRLTPVEDGYYSSADKVKIKKDLTYFQKIGINYIILDDTNGHGNDDGNIALACDCVFQVANEMGAANTPQVCFAAGRPLINGDAAGMKGEMDIFYGYAKMYKDLYFQWRGLPLFVNFTDPVNYGYKDERFTIRVGSGVTSAGAPSAKKYGLDKNGMYGWVFDHQYPDSEVYGITPGWSRHHNNMFDTTYPEVSRENGARYQRMWLEAVKAKKEMIVITGWNEHGEETGIEAVTLREPIKGRDFEHLNPYYYQQITEGYLALKKGYLNDFYYKNEKEDQLYQYKNGKLSKVDSVKQMTAVIVVPDDYFEWSGVQFA